MLYKKNQSKKLSDELFNNPTSEYRGAPFWAWNCKLTGEMLTEQIGILSDMGFGGFHMHARTGLDTEYLGEEFLDLVNLCCDTAEEKEMLAWLYDEDRWSSGPAGGKVTKTPQFRRKRFCMFPEDQGWDTPKEIALKEGKPYLLSCYDVQLDTEGYLTDYRRISKDETAMGTKWYAYCFNEKQSTWFNGETYVDAMNPEAIAEFIKITHEAYASSIGDRMGKSVPAIFTDEPNINHEWTSVIPSPDYKGRILGSWTRFAEEEYQKAYGEDLLDIIPEIIWYKKDRSDAKYKHRWYDLLGKLFAENYFGQIQKWCHDHNLASMGHLLREPLLSEQIVSSGETMRCYNYLDIPGMDILIDGHEYTTAKQVQSVVHQGGKEAMMSELYGVTNWDYEFRGHKSQGDWQAALGVTVRVPHLAWMSMAGEAKRDYPASINYQSPWYKEYPLIENHFSRVNTAMTRGVPVIKVGVIHPVESAWISTGPATQSKKEMDRLETNFKSITTWLLEEHYDFNYISEALLPSQIVPDMPTRVGQMSYEVIVVPGCLTLRETTLEYLKNFQAAGGVVLFMGECPGYVNGIVSDGCKELYQSSEVIPFERLALASALRPVRQVSITHKGIEHAPYFYQMRKDNDNSWLFLARHIGPGAIFESSSFRNPQDDVVVPETLEITVKGEFTPKEYNTMTGEILPIDYKISDGKTTITKVMHGYDSLLLSLEPATAAEFVLPTDKFKPICKWDFKGAVPYRLSEPNVLLLDIAEYALDDESYQPAEEILRLDSHLREKLGYSPRDGKLAQTWTRPQAEPEHTLRLRFTFESQLELTGTSLAIEDAEVVEVTLNGQKADNTVTGYFTDQSIKTISLPPIKAGENVLELAIPFGERTNTEWCYILGEFGVQVYGCDKVLTPMPAKVGFGDLAAQGFPFYGANLAYLLDVDLPKDGYLKVNASYYRGSLIGVTLDDEKREPIVFPPYETGFGAVPAGKHRIELTIFGNRHNCFGPLHSVNEQKKYSSPKMWRTDGDDWSYEYRLKRLGILKSPVVFLDSLC